MRFRQNLARALRYMCVLTLFLTACMNGAPQTEQYKQQRLSERLQAPPAAPGIETNIKGTDHEFNGPIEEQKPEPRPARSSAESSKSGNNLSAKEDPVKQISQKVKRDVKGVYVSAYALQGEKWDRIKRLLSTTEINAVVVDVKNDSGRITYPSGVQTAKEIGADASAKVKDISPLLEDMQKQDVYTIARIVTFKDPLLAAKKPEWAIKTKSGKIWRDNRGVSWLDPYNEEVWDYTIELAKEALKVGFDEVQFDYVRFPEQVIKIEREVAFYNPYNETKDQIIARFLNKATKEIHEWGGVVSADVFGLTTTAKDGMGIGQKWELLVPEVDAISPMIYPSHYMRGSYGVSYPDLQPYSIVSEAVKDANARNAKLKATHERVARIRPWIQDFTAKWIKPHQTYRRTEVMEQIKALQKQGIYQYLLWNASCNYSL
jgi:hypothetical protein